MCRCPNAVTAAGGITTKARLKVGSVSHAEDTEYRHGICAFSLTKQCFENYYGKIEIVM